MVQCNDAEATIVVIINFYGCTSDSYYVQYQVIANVHACAAFDSTSSEM